MIRAAVRAWGARDRADEIELAADELITNALLHTEGSAVVTLRSLVGASAGCASRWRTPPAPCRAAATRGRTVSPAAVCSWWTGSPTPGGGGAWRRQGGVVRVPAAVGTGPDGPRGVVGAGWHSRRMRNCPR